MRRELKVFTLRSAVFQLAVFTIIQGIGLAQQNLTWTQMCSPPGPQLGYFAAMAYDSVRENVVLFGGATLTNNVELNETWIWNGAGWIQLFPANPPPARAAHAMAFDAARGDVVLFGGVVGGVPSQDTWIWNGVTWTQKFPVTVPPARFHAGMVFDTTLQKFSSSAEPAARRLASWTTGHGTARTGPHWHRSPSVALFSALPTIPFGTRRSYMAAKTTANLLATHSRLTALRG